jgi:putative membrane protein
VKRFSLFLILTVAVYCCSLQFALAQDDTQSSADGVHTNRPFLARAIEASAAEIELGKMAEAKSQNPRVRAYAQMMVKDHATALDAFHRIATGGIAAVPNQESATNTAQLSGRVPLSKEHQELRDRLSRLSGDDFDREYMSAMVQEHRKDVRDFEREVKSGSDTGSAATTEPAAAVREKPQDGADGTQAMTPQRIIARDLLPILKMHLEQAETFR